MSETWFKRLGLIALPSKIHSARVLRELKLCGTLSSSKGSVSSRIFLQTKVIAENGPVFIGLVLEIESGAP